MRRRLVAAFVAVLAIVLLTQNVPLVAYLRDVEEDRQRTSLERDAFIIAGRSEELLDAGLASDDLDLQNLVDDYRSEEGHRVVIVDRLGAATVISDETAASGADYSTRPEIGRALTGRIASGRRYSDTLGTDLFYVAVPVFSGDEVVGAIRLTSPASEIDDRVSSRITGIVAVVLIAMALGIVVALVLAQGITRPLRGLRDSTNSLASGNLDARADTDHGPPEMRALAESFNAMSARLRTLVETQRAFAGDASHQLRTPLTALRLQIEQALGAIEAAPSRSKDELERATVEIDRLQHLVEGLLVLARLEESNAPRESTDVSRVIRERIEVWSPLIEENRGTLEADVEPDRFADLLNGTLEQILDNLIDNALNASDDSPAIVISLRRDASANALVLEVMDRGQGMTDEDMRRAFDRFWRAPTNSASGSGIGLSIVSRLVEVNRGSVCLLPRPGGGVIARVSLPQASRN